MATVGVPPQGLFSTLLFGDNDEFETLLADDLAAFRSRLETSHHSTQSTSSPPPLPPLFSYLFLMGDEDDALILAEEAGAQESSPIAPPKNSEFIENLQDARVEESGSVCSICLDEMSIGSRAKRLPCSHVYHGRCIGEWLKKTNTCPICRHPMPS